MAHVYILRCADGSYYVGSTVNLAARLHQHRIGGGSEYTKRRLPVELAWSYEFERVADAFAAEKKVQGWSRAKREALMRGEFDLLPSLARKQNFRRDA